MYSENKYTGFAIAIAWPQTYCKQPGAWYDPMASLVGINKNHYYQVGHAALVLVDNNHKKAHYFDFGRYHSPYQYGRVRSADTDHELEIKTIPQITEDGLKLDNYRNILHEIQTNTACHGEGTLYASYCRVNFNNSYFKAQKMQDESPIAYGPFKIGGSNCSRFVNSVIRAGKPKIGHWFGLNFKVPLTPMPMNNVNALTNRIEMPKLQEETPFYPANKLNAKLLKTTLPAPNRHPNIPEIAQWLSGEGAGSWFVLFIINKLLKVTRYSPQGVIECTGLFENKDAIKMLHNHQSYKVAYPSNCQKVFLKVDNLEFAFNKVLE